MEFSQLTTSQQGFLGVLEVFSEPVSVDIAAELSDISAGDLHNLVRRLVKQSWLTEKDDNSLGLSTKIPKKFQAELKNLNTQERLSDLLDQIKKLNIRERLSPTMYHQLLVRCRHHEEAAELAYQDAVLNIKNADYDEALKNLHSCLLGLGDRLDSSKNAGLYISATLKLSGLINPLPKSSDFAEGNLMRACQLADKLGDRRNQAFISLYQGFFLKDRYQIKEAMDYLESGLEAVKTLDDEEITSQASEFFAYYYSLQGLFREATSYFDQAESYRFAKDIKQLKVYLHFPIYHAHTAAFNGQFHRAVGVLDSTLKAAQANSNPFLARLCQANLGSVLLMMGKRGEAYTHLEACLEESSQEEDLESLIWSRRALAWYYLQEGDIRRSHAMFRRCLSGAEEIGAPQPFYAFPWNLELLFAFYKEGLIKGEDNTFEQEMQFALKGINGMMKGVAFRLRAKQADLDKKDTNMVRSWLEQSMTELIRANNPIELAKTRAEMAKIYHRAGDKARAHDEALQAWMLFGYDGFSDDLKPLIRNTDLLPMVSDFRKDWLAKYIELMKGLLPRGDENEMLSSLVSSTVGFFESERGGIFKFDTKNQFPTLLVGYNLSINDVEKKAFMPQIRQILKAHGSHRPVIDTVLVEDSNQIRSRESHVLCLPFHTKNLEQGVLYYDNTWSEGVYKSLDPAVLTKLTGHLGEYIDSINGFSSHMKEISRQVIVQTVKGESEVQTIVANNSVMKKLLDRTKQVAPSEAPVLIQGETGVGKELLARYVHNNSGRKSMPFIAVNFASIPENLLESELFGHEKGAFTGAVSRKPGLLELADKGTLFIDEVGDIPKSIQIKLLRVLQEKTFMRVGGIREHNSDFRIVAATNRDMSQEVAAGNFREDLFYRINIVTLHMSPLRKRGQDVIDLALHFLKQYARAYNRAIPSFKDEDKKRLLGYQWPGNVRELKNVIERAVLLSTSDMLELSMPSLSPESRSHSTSGEISFPDNISLDEIQQRYISHILKKTNGKISGAGGATDVLGLNRSTLYSRMRKMGMM